VKKLSLILLGIFTYATVFAQTITLRFEGTANASTNNSRDYAVDLDGRWYYSSNATGNSGVKQIMINDLNLGTHKLSVYDAGSNSSNELLYSNNFTLRTGYDLIIAVRRNGNVTFTEKKMNEGASASNSLSMADAEFSKLHQSVKAKWSQSSRITAIKSAFANNSYYFTTDQVGQLLLLVTSEARRLELAKLSFPRVTDQNNFADVGELFTVKTQKNSFEDFLAAQNVTTNDEVYGVHTPVTTQKFNQLAKKVRNQYKQAGKVAVLEDAFKVTTDYYTTAQIRQLLAMITSEADRLALAKLSFAQVADEGNFASLYDMFSTQANRDEFNNYVRYGGSITSGGQYASRIAMSESDFNKLYMKTQLHFRQSSVVSDIKEALSNKNNYFTIEQTRQLLSLVGSEADKLSLAKLAWHRSADPNNFTQLFDIFTQVSINELNAYIRANPL